MTLKIGIAIGTLAAVTAVAFAQNHHQGPVQQHKQDSAAQTAAAQQQHRHSDHGTMHDSVIAHVGRAAHDSIMQQLGHISHDSLMVIMHHIHDSLITQLGNASHDSIMAALHGVSHDSAMTHMHDSTIAHMHSGHDGSGVLAHLHHLLHATLHHSRADTSRR